MARTRSGSNTSLQATSRGRSKSATPVPVSNDANDNGRPLRRSKRLEGAGKRNGGDSSDEEKRPPPRKPADKNGTNSKREKKAKKAHGDGGEDEEAAVNGLSVIKEGDEEDEAAPGAGAGQRHALPQSLDDHQASARPSLQQAVQNNNSAEGDVLGHPDVDMDALDQQPERASPQPESGQDQNGDHVRDSREMSPRTLAEDRNLPAALGTTGPRTISTNSSQRSLFHDYEDGVPVPDGFDSLLSEDAQVDSTEIASTSAITSQNADEANGVSVVPGELGGAYRSNNQAADPAIGPIQALANLKSSSEVPAVSESSNASRSHDLSVDNIEDAAIPREGSQTDDETRQKSRKRKISDSAKDGQASHKDGASPKRPRLDDSEQKNVVPTPPEQEHDKNHKLTAEELASWDAARSGNWRSLHSNDCSLNECNEYRELYAKALEMKAEGGKVVPPQGNWGSFVVGRSPRRYLDATRKSLKDAYHKYVDTEWKRYINHVAREEVPDKTSRMVEKEHRRMLKYSRITNNWPYKPRCEPEDVPELSPVLEGADLAKALGFGTSLPATLHGTWNFSHTLGFGSFGHAGLWQQFDAAGNIIRRVAVKESYLPGSMWEESRFWYRNEQPLEGTIMQTLPDFKHIVKCHAMSRRNNAAYAKFRIQRFYLEYCPHGDLRFTVNEHLRLKEFQTSDNQPINFRLPINLLWSVFEALISVTCLMKNGSLPPQLPIPNWQTIVHRDIKPSNIFLSEPSKPNSHGISTWPGIPVPKIADFGIGCFVDAKGNWLKANPIGTDGYRAPERLQTTRVPEDPSKIDLWSSARVILALMNLDRENTEDVFIRNGEDSRDVLDFKDGMREYYDERCPKLVRMVEECLSEDPEKRPVVEDLWQEIQNEVARYRDLDMEVLPIKMTKIADDEPLVRYKVEQWPMWSR